LPFHDELVLRLAQARAAQEVAAAAAAAAAGEEEVVVAVVAAGIAGFAGTAVAAGGIAVFARTAAAAAEEVVVLQDKHFPRSAVALEPEMLAGGRQTDRRRQLKLKLPRGEQG